MSAPRVDFEITRPSLEEVEYFAQQSIGDTYEVFQAECQRIAPRSLSFYRFECPDDISATLEPRGDSVSTGSDILHEDQYLLDLRGTTITNHENRIAYSGVMKLTACLQSPWVPRKERKAPGLPSIGMEYWIEAFGGPVAEPITPHFLEELGIHGMLQDRIPNELAQGRNDVVDETVIVEANDEVDENSRLIKVAFGVATMALKNMPSYEKPDYSTFHPVVGSSSSEREQRLERLRRY